MPDSNDQVGISRVPHEERSSAFHWEETLQPGATWSHVLKRGTALRITDLEGGANVGAVFYNFECPAERYNVADTLDTASEYSPKPVGLSIRTIGSPGLGDACRISCPENGRGFILTERYCL